MNTETQTATQPLTQPTPSPERALQTAGPVYEPRVELNETEEALILTAELPGVAPEDLETDLRENVLTVTGRVHPPDAKWKLAYAESRPGTFRRQFRLGQRVDQAKIQAQLKDGVLTLTLPKADHARARKIPVQAS